MLMNKKNFVRTPCEGFFWICSCFLECTFYIKLSLVRISEVPVITKLRILHECSYIIKYIEQVEENGIKFYALPSILSFFRNKFDKLYILGAQLFDSIYHMTLKLV